MTERSFRPPSPQAPPFLQALAGRAHALPVLACLALAACGHSSDGPVAWWHGLEGGPIAAQRPPPPGADAPYPNLGSVPARPAPIDPAARARIYAGLSANRADATYEAQQDPLHDAPARTTTGLFAGAAPLPAPPADTAGAALDAATPAPPPPAAAPPARPIEPELLDSKPIAPLAADTTPAPAIPDVPPPQPHIAGVSLPVTIPRLPPRAPPPPAAVAPALTAADAAFVTLAFPPGSAVLPKPGKTALAGLAARRGAHAIAVVGFGDSGAVDADAQIAGLHLALARARAVATALAGDGVPPASLRMTAETPGRGAAARLID